MNENEQIQQEKKILRSFQYSYRHFDSGNPVLNNEYKSIVSACIDASYPQQQEIALSNIMEMTDRFHRKKKVLFGRLKYDLKNYIDSTKKLFPDNFLFARKIAGAQNILSRLESEFKMDMNTAKNEDNQKQDELNLHPQIFKDAAAFQLFSLLHESFSEKRYILANYSFIYRRMYKDGLIYEHVRDVAFRNWLNEKYDIDIDSTKTLEQCTTDGKEAVYKNAKNSIYAQKSKP